MGIGTTTPTQTLDVNGQLRVRGLSGSDARLPVVRPDGTLGVNAPVYGTMATTPTFPTAAMGSVATGTNPFGVAVSGTTAYVVNNSSSTLQVFNVATPSAPVLLGSVATGGNPTSVAVSGTTAYVVNLGSSNTLQVFDVATPSAPVLRGSVATSSESRNVAVSGTMAYVVNDTGSRLQVFDVATPSAPVLRGSVATDARPFSVAVSGTTAYVVNFGSSTLQTFNVATPSAPMLLATVPTGSEPRSVAVSGTTAYVVNGSSNSLQAFNVTTPSAPVLLGTVTTGSSPQSLAMSGTTAYVVNLASSTLQAFTFPGPPRAVAVNPDGSLASVVLPDGTNFLQNQTAAVQTGGFNLSGNGYLGGNMGIGTSNPLAGLHVDKPESGSTTVTGVLLSGGTNGNPSIELRGSGKVPYIDFSETSGVDYTTRLISSGGVLNVNGAGNGGLLFQVNGNMQATNVTFTSDARFKTNVRPLGGALASVLALRGVRYAWNALGIQHGGTAHAEQVGVLAQEVEKVYPELVTTGADGYKAVNYAQLAPVLIEAVKELSRQVQTLQTQNAALRTGSAGDHASLLTLQAQLARLLEADAQAHR